jgi:hypothetical protein
MCITYDEKFKGTDKPCLYDCFCCGKVYQVVQINALAARPKCHQCREGLPPAATNDCIKCHNRFITYNQPEQDWVCGCCESGQEPLEELEVRVEKVVEENPVLINKSLEEITKNQKYSDRLLNLWDAKWTTEFPEHTHLVLSNKPILLDPQAMSRLITSTDETGTCNICFSNVYWGNLHSICGNKECQITACETCLETYWSKNAPGQLFCSASCPYCRRDPKRTIWKRWNKPQWKDLTVPENLDPTMYHFWCIECNTVKPYITRECAGDVPELHGQRCADCQQREREANYQALVAAQPDGYEDDGDWSDNIGLKKNCPSCDVLIEHDGGCNHMTCACGTHFCFVCLETWCDGDDIYSHFGDSCPMYGL